MIYGVAVDVLIRGWTSWKLWHLGGLGARTTNLSLEEDGHALKWRWDDLQYDGGGSGFQKTVFGKEISDTCEFIGRHVSLDPHQAVITRTLHSTCYLHSPSKMLRNFPSRGTVAIYQADSNVSNPLLLISNHPHPSF